MATGNNIHIGNEGASTDSNVITIGHPAETVTKLAGIYGQNIETPNSYVCIDSTRRLGTNCVTVEAKTPSSRRFKEQIADMGDSSSKLLQLRPVTFLYKPEYDDGSHALQYGLIAEEVAKVYPDMVGYDKDGQPTSVKYQSLAPMLLNEVQKQNAQLQDQNVRLQNQVQVQQEENRKLEDRLAALEAQLSTLTAAPVLARGRPIRGSPKRKGEARTPRINPGTNRAALRFARVPEKNSYVPLPSRCWPA